MRHHISAGIRVVVVLIGVVGITSVGVDATDALRGSSSALVIFSRFMTEPACPVEMVRVSDGTSSYCIDRYEAGVGSTCPFPEPFSVVDTAKNARADQCVPQVLANVRPWRFVTSVQAAQLCARAGKRLPTPREWYVAALGTSDDGTICNLHSGAIAQTGQFGACNSGVGAVDMIGNVWEFVAGEVADGQMLGTALPSQGYVAEVSSDGMPTVTVSTSKEIYNEDYFWTNASGTYAMMRGGYYGSRSDGGLYGTQAAISPSFSSAAIGFRCVKSL